MKAKEIKKIFYDLGADLCGIASVDRFDEAPEGFHPCDILPSCKSVIVFAKSFPVGTLKCKSNIPYTIARNILCSEMDVMAVKFCEIMEKSGNIAVPTGTVSHTRLDEKTGRYRAAISAKHSAVAAGLGRIGKNTLFVTPEYGNMVWLSVVLIDTKLKADDVLGGNPCDENCTICIDNCPVGALGNPEMNQGACFGHAYAAVEGQELVIGCHKCRSLCPNCFGTRNTIDVK